jgi:hypothetical protein
MIEYVTTDTFLALCLCMVIGGGLLWVVGKIMVALSEQG